MAFWNKSDGSSYMLLCFIKYLLMHSVACSFCERVCAFFKGHAASAKQRLQLTISWEEVMLQQNWTTDRTYLWVCADFWSLDWFCFITPPRDHISSWNTRTIASKNIFKALFLSLVKIRYAHGKKKSSNSLILILNKKKESKSETRQNNLACFFLHYVKAISN